MTIENTGKVLFEDDVPQWYVAHGDRWDGPLTASDVYQKVLKQEIGWAHYVWKPGKSGWERICDLKEFQAAVPPLPGKDLREEVKEAAKPVVRQANPVRGGEVAQMPPALGKGHEFPEEEKIWYLYFKEAQYGPFTHNEIVQVIQSGKVNGSVFAWRDGMADWEHLENIGVFKDFFGQIKKKSPPPPAPQTRNTRAKGPVSGLAENSEGDSSSLQTIVRDENRSIQDRRGKQSWQNTDQRQYPRRPLVARILMTQGDLLITAMCRDVSVGGLQVLTDRIPGPVGSRIKMNVSATDGRGSDAYLSKTKIEPFVAEGVIVRILEDGRGFSFRFDQLTDSAKRAIETYINNW